MTRVEFWYWTIKRLTRRILGIGPKLITGEKWRFMLNGHEITAEEAITYYKANSKIPITPIQVLGTFEPVEVRLDNRG